MKRITLLMLLLITLVLNINAQNGSIKGRIVDSKGLSLPAANVYITDLSNGTISDINGYYSIAGLEEGRYKVSVSYIGFKPMMQDVEIKAGKTTVLDLKMEPGVEIAEVVVTGRLQGQSKALNKQKNNMNISNIIASDQVGKFPDDNIGDAMKRIPGINVQYDQGEARFGNIRGTAPQYNSVTINGERIPSAEAEIRSIQLDLVPSNMIKMVEVNKAVTPDMDADAIGASVNLVTKAAPYERRISGSVGSGYNVLTGKPILTGSLLFGDRFANNKIGMILSASYHNHQLGSDNMESEWSFDDANDNDKYEKGEGYWTEEIQIRQYYLQRVRQSYSASFDFKLNPNHIIYLKGIYNWRNDWENRYRTVHKDIEEDGSEWIAELEKQTKAGIGDNKFARLEDQRMMNFSLSGDHFFGMVKVDWSASYSQASENRPNERYLELGGESPISLDISNEKNPMITINEADFKDISSAWEFGELTEEHQFTKDEDIAAKINFELPLMSGQFENKLKFGGKYRSKIKIRDNKFFEYSPIDEDAFMAKALGNSENFSKDNFLAGDYSVGSFITPEFVGDLNLENTSEFEKEKDLSEYAGNFDATEQVIAGYAMLNQSIGDKFSAILGVRFEQTTSENEGRKYDDDAETLENTPKESNTYTNILPNLHIRFAPSNYTILRFAYTNTIARPNYYDLVPHIEIEDGVEISIGNTKLEPTLSTNIDVMFEQYFRSIGLVSGGLFYKNITDFMVDERYKDYTYEGTTWEKFKRPINGGNAVLWGIELAGQRQLDFLPGFLNGFGLYANYTYTHSEVTEFNLEGRENETLKMPGSPTHTLNTSLMYDSKKLSASISFNYASDFIDEVGEDAFFDRYYDKVTHLDLNLSYIVNPNFTIFIDANNLLNQPLRYYQGEQSRTMQSEYYGIRFKAGLKFDF